MNIKTTLVPMSVRLAWSFVLAALGGTTFAGPMPTDAPCTAVQFDLTLDSPAGACLAPGDTVTVVLSMGCVNDPVYGYQAFVSYDPSALEFVSGEYQRWDRFGMPLLSPITATNGEIDLAAGVDPFTGQPPITAGRAELVELVFRALSRPLLARSCRAGRPSHTRNL